MRNRPPPRRPSRPPARANRATEVATREPAQAPALVIPTGPIALPPALTVKELAERLSLSPANVIRELLQNGVIAGIKCNQGEDFKYWLVGDWVRGTLTNP